MYLSTFFRIPLKQGLRLLLYSVVMLHEYPFFRIPLKQGLRRLCLSQITPAVTFFRIPLKQGLRQGFQPFKTA